ncbi:MAG: hypothetical protein HeimC3_33820 [Candidatus Heimdallarchaeota archaeon LC_3]|nr:MAG: hypothetical protein HeimC3_33820 [Candidatus Heimdallarchaeota archaeon LC_3]
MTTKTAKLMNRIYYFELVVIMSSEEEINGIFYRNFSLYIQPAKLLEDLIIVFAMGSANLDINEGWDWEFHTLYVTADPNAGKMELIYTPEENQEIKGHLVTNLQGIKLYSSFAPFIRGINGRMEINTPGTTEPIVEKFKIGETLPIDHLVHVKTTSYNFSDPQVELDLKNYFERHTRYEDQTIRIIEPYLSERLINLVDQSVDKGTNVKILTVQTSGMDASFVRSKIATLSQKDISVEIKQICRINQSVNITNRKTDNPFHDRMVIINNGVLMIGVSFNGLFKNNTTIQEYSGGNTLKKQFDDWFQGINISYENITLQFKAFT